MNVTPSCKYLHPNVKSTYWEECYGFYNEFCFVCGQGIICAIVVSLTFINTPNKLTDKIVLEKYLKIIFINKFTIKRQFFINVFKLLVLFTTKKLFSR